MNFENADSAIKKLLSDYFDVMHHQDMSVFDKVFHKNCALYSTQTGELSLRPYDVYLSLIHI